MRLLHFPDSRLTRMVRLSALRADSSLPAGKLLILISVRSLVEARDIVRLETLFELKSRVNSSGLEPSTFRLVALCLSPLHYGLPHVILWVVEIIEIGVL
jgi:hypothetical protein